MTDGTIHLPAVQMSTRQHRAEIRDMKEKLVRQPVVKLKIYAGLKKMDDLLTEKIKLEDAQASKKPSKPPKEPA